MIANLQEVKRYDWDVEDNHYYCADSVDGEWCKFEEAVEASSNNLQQLKAEIADIVITLSRHKYSEFTKKTYNVLLKRMRQLSAV